MRTSTSRYNYDAYVPIERNWQGIRTDWKEWGWREWGWREWGWKEWGWRGSCFFFFMLPIFSPNPRKIFLRLDYEFYYAR